VRGLLFALVQERRAAAQTPEFVPRELSAEEHARLAEMAARGQWDRDAAAREAAPAVLRDLLRRACVAFRRNRAKPVVRVERVYGDARKGAA